MAKRSLQASVEGIRKARQAFKRKGWTQEYLAAEVGLETRQPIWKFFSGKPVDRQVFHEICFVLELEPEEIRLHDDSDVSAQDDSSSSGTVIPLPPISGTESMGISANPTQILDAQVQHVRSILAEKIQHQCGWLRLLDVARPLSLDELYVDVKIVEEVSSHRWLNLATIQTEQTDDHQGWERLKVQVDNSPSTANHAHLLASDRSLPMNGIEVVENHPRLMVLGKPGAGKTTFLQAIAIKCNQGSFKADCVPIFISLKRFAEAITPTSLLEFIEREFSESGLSAENWHNFFIWGRAVILLDGLDEVGKNASNWVVREICTFCDRYYKTQVIVSCRVAAQLYQFQNFTAVQIADLTPAQIFNFVQRWFYSVGKLPPQNASEKAEQFIQKLELPENYAIRELATTPILLNLMCLVFSSLGDFPNARAQLYKQGLDLLLVRWDETRGITRDQTYQNLSLQDKIRILSRIAVVTFNNGDYFFWESQIKHAIGDVIQEIQGTPIDANALEINCQAIIKAIESQHGLLLEQGRGIYSFSHLTFQEYFTAWEIALNSDRQALDDLVNHLWEPRWREVLLLTAGMSPQVHYLFELMQQQMYTVRNSSPQLGKYLQWIDNKAQSLQQGENPTAVRAFYYTLSLPSFHPLAGDQSLALAIEPKFAVDLGLEIGLDMALRHAVALSQTIIPEIFSQRIIALRMALELEGLAQIDPELDQIIQRLLAQLPDNKAERSELKTWWQTHGITWTNELRSQLIQHRQIGYDWQITPQESESIQQYWQVCKIIHDCLLCAVNLSPNQSQAIMDSLFNPN